MTDSRRVGVRGYVTALSVQLTLFAVQLVVGITVNLYAPIPAVHPGSVSRGGGYFTDLGRVIGWAFSGGPVTLAAHVALGLTLVAVGIAVVVLAVRSGGAGGIILSAVGLACVIVAVFAGSTFLIDANNNLDSLIMEVLFTAAATSYVLALATALKRRPALPPAPSAEVGTQGRHGARGPGVTGM